MRPKRIKFVLMTMVIFSVLVLVQSQSLLADDTEQDSSIEGLITSIGHYEDEGAFANSAAPRALKTHLTAIRHYEQQEKLDKAVQHMENFEFLLNHQLDQDLLSADAHQDLKTQSASVLTSLKSVLLANNGNAMYGVYVGSDDNAIEYHAAEELVQYLSEVTSAPFELSTGTNPPNGPAILVGRNDLTESLIPELTDDSLGEDGFVIRKTQQYIVIAGSHPRGTMYGVNYFLDDYVGVKWFSPQYTVVPSISKLKLHIDDDVQVPRFEYREMYVNDGSDEHFRAHNLLNGKFRDRHGHVPESEPWLDSWSTFWPYDVHNFHRIVPQTEYHYGRQLLAMSEDVRRIATENLISKINQRISEGEDPSFSFSQEDWGWDPDPDSQAFADQHGGTLAAPIFDMVGDVAERVRAEIPNARIGTLAYMFTEQAPVNMTVPDNVVITLAPIFKDHGRPINSAANQFSWDNAEQWAQISDNIVVWDYITDFSGGGYIMPYPSLYAMSETIQYLAQFPAYKGYFGQGAHNMNAPASTGINDLITWIGARLLWNPDQDYHQLIDEFVEGYYGDAAPYIGEYVELLHQIFDESDSALWGTSTSISSSYLSFDLAHQADALFDQAVAAVAEDPVYLNHVQRTRIEMDYVILMRGVDYMQEALERDIDWEFDYENRFARFKTYTADIVDYKINGSMESLYAEMAIERTVPTIPDLVKDLPESEWMDFQDYAFRLYAPVGTTIVNDPKASDHAAARVTGSTNAWAIQLPNTTLPREGQWKLYANVRVDPGDGAPDDIAFLHGIYPPIENEAEVTYEEVSDGEYHFFELPGVYEFDPDISNHYSWLAPPNSNTIEYLYVDRIIAIKQ